ncbi:MAG: lactate utilization protein [Candidatus Omnitrophota bacterium]
MKNPGINKEIEELFSRWKRRNIAGSFCENKFEALEMIKESVPEAVSVGVSGSQTLDQLGVIAMLEAAGRKVFNQNKPGISRQESLELRRLGAGADYYLASANAIARTGELVFLSAYGNRTAGVANARNVVIVCGVNKLSDDLPAALSRAREYATPLNCKRLDWKSACLENGHCREVKCFAPEYRRMCAQLLIIESEVAADRLKVILVNESLGF